MNRVEIRRKMLEADRLRAQIVYADGVSDAAIARRRKTPEYQAANEEFKRSSALLNDDRGPEDLKKMFRI